MLEPLQDMDTFATAVALLLPGLGLGVLAVLVERWASLARSRHESAAFEIEATHLIATNDWARLRERAQSFPGSHHAAMLGSVLDLLSRNDGRVKPPWLDVLRREIFRRHADARADLRRGFVPLMVVACAAPVVGLISSLAGILVESVAAALGIGVAVLAMTAFQILSAGADRLTRNLESSARQFIDQVAAHSAGHPVTGLRLGPARDPRLHLNADMPAA